MKVKGQDNFIKTYKIIIEGNEYVRCGRANQFLRGMGIKPPEVYAMKLHQKHHYMPVKTFEYVLRSLIEKRKNR